MLESKKRANKKYNAKYKERITTIRFDCYPTDSDIIEHLEAKKAAGEKIATYIKGLIREDMQKDKDLDNRLEQAREMYNKACKEYTKAIKSFKERNFPDKEEITREDLIEYFAKQKG